jgi:hypothetical protein
MRPSTVFNSRIATAAALVIAVAGCTPEKKQDAAGEAVAVPQVLEGDAVIASAADVVRLSRYTGITGKLVIKRAEVDRVELPNLEFIGGKLYVQKTRLLTRLSMPRLARIGDEPGEGAVIERNEALRTVVLSDLETVSCSLIVRLNPALAELDLGSLLTLPGQGLEVSDDDSIETLSLPSAREISYLTIRGNKSLKRIAAPSLESVLYVAIEDNESLASIAMDALSVLYADPSKNAAKSELSISRNASLETLDGFANLKALGRNRPLRITENKSLPTCRAMNLRDRLTQGGWKGESEICGNEQDGCVAVECAKRE